MDRSNKRFLVVTALVFGAVIVTELRKSPDERTWHGKLAGVVPYDLRPPTLERVRSTVWNPNDPHVLVPHAFGVGWTINAAALVQRVRKPVG
jgi:hypothetical protein